MLEALMRSTENLQNPKGIELMIKLVEETYNTLPVQNLCMLFASVPKEQQLAIQKITY